MQACCSAVALTLPPVRNSCEIDVNVHCKVNMPDPTPAQSIPRNVKVLGAELIHRMSQQQIA